MEFRILGSLEVAEGNDAISLDAPKPRALLGVLLLHPNEVVSSDRLIDELWGDRPPATATKVVQNYVSQLRKAVGNDVIVTRPPGYMLRIEEDELDATRFRHLTSEGRVLAARGEPARADALYREALALWRGPPLANVVLESLGRSEVEGLDEERLGALMDRIDCELALGRHDELVTELETLVRQYPLRERFRAQLMLALYRSGRQADALSAYQAARRTLVEELGLEPSDDLQFLERAILNHDAALRAPRVARRARMPRRHPRWSVLAATTLLLLTGSLGIAFALRDEQPAPTLLPHNYVGFIDAESGRVTQTFQVGRAPRALVVAFDTLWVANYRDQTVSRIDRETGLPTATIPIPGHPTGIAPFGSMIWVATLEGLVVPIDPRFDRARKGDAIGLGEGIPGGIELGEIAAGGGYLWITAPPTKIFRRKPGDPVNLPPIVPNTGVEPAIAFRGGSAWAAGSGQVFPIAADTGNVRSGTTVGGSVRDLAFGGDSLWVVSGRPPRGGGVAPALRPVDLRTRLHRTTISVGDRPVAVAAAAGSIWVGSSDGNDGVVYRVDPADDDVVDTIRVGSLPTVLTADDDGVWVAVE